jgi:hypothetical protein
MPRSLFQDMIEYLGKERHEKYMWTWILSIEMTEVKNAESLKNKPYEL